MNFERKYGVADILDGIPLITAGGVDYKINPTLAAGDVKISKDGAAFIPLATLPTVTPSGDTSVRISLSASEFTCKRAVIRFIDQTATKEWEDQEIIIETFGHALAQTPFKHEGIWDRGLTGATHNIPTSAGRRLRQLAGIIFDDGTAQAGGVNTITLASGASSTDGIFWQTYIFIVEGTGAGQGHHIIAYDGATRVATIDDDWVIQPDNTSEYTLFGSGSHEAMEEGTPTAVTNNTITLNTYSPSVDDQLKHLHISIISGTGNRQTRRIIAYNGTTKVATMDENWAVNPNTSSGYWIQYGNLTVDDVWDELLQSDTHNVNKSAGKIVRELKEIAGYEGGFIYIDTIGGSAGDEAFINGTLENPVDNMTDLNTLAATLGISSFRVAAGSSIVLAASQERQVFIGEIWSLDLGGQSISATTFHGADVSGIATGAIKPKFEDCNIGDVTLPPCHMDKCGLGGTITAGSVGDFFLADNCHSAVAGVGSPVIDFGVVVGDVGFNLRWYSGGIDLRNMGQTGIDKASIEGNGQVIINDNCVGSVGSQIAIRGHQERYGGDPFIAGGGIIVDDARFDVNNIAAHAVNVISALSGSISVESVKNGGTIILYQNTAMAIPIDLEKDMSGNDIFFSAVRDLDDAAYTIPDGGITPKNVTADFNLVTGEGLLSFTATELNIAPGTLEVEVHSTPSVGGDDVPEMIFKIKLKDHPSNL